VCTAQEKGISSSFLAALKHVLAAAAAEKTINKRKAFILDYTGRPMAGPFCCGYPRFFLVSFPVNMLIL
jgi:hypothetical protein